MHGQEGEEWKRRWHMWPVPSHGITIADSRNFTADSFCKDGSKISVGDCALFQAGNSPPFIGIIRWLTSGREDILKLGVNWLYRPAEIKLGKGILLEAAPNEVFYSFHKDEIPAASLLHPCKVAFLRKGVELPSGISSFVCRRVYDIANKCLWWLTDQDYINERQEEVDQLLDKTQLEMHAAVQSGGRSPKPLNGPTSTQQLKPGSDSVQNSVTSFPSQGKVKKRGRGDQCLEPIKRERSSKTDDRDSGHSTPESTIKAEVAKIIDKGGLINSEGVEKLVNLMQLDRTEKKIDLAGRIMLADVIASTDRFECLGSFVHLRGVTVLDDWLQEAHKGKIGDDNIPKESDKSVEELLLVLLRALDKLPVNLHALQTCNVGKSVNHLRSHKNLEIQKKARSLVDTWKKRVEAEMNNDAKTGSSQAVTWAGKPGFSEVSHGGNRRIGSSEVPIKSSITQPSSSKVASIKPGHGDAVTKLISASSGSIKMMSSLSSSVMISPKDLHCKMTGSSGTSDLPLATIKEEKSSSSSQSQNNSQSCSSDHTKTVASACREDARSSTAGSISANKTTSSASRNRKSSNGFMGSGVSGVPKESSLGKPGSINRTTSSDKASQSGLTCDRVVDMSVDHGNSHRLIVRLSNPGRSPARSASGGSFEDPSVIGSRASSPGVSEKHDSYDHKAKGKSDARRANIVADVNTESWQSNDVKDGLMGSEEVGGSPAAVLDEERSRNTDETVKTMDVLKATCASSGNDKRGFLSESKSGKSYEASYSSINALVDSCVKYSEASASLSAGDDLGMNLLASVAAGEMSTSNQASPIGSPGRNSPAQEDSFTGNNDKLRFSRDDVVAEGQGGADGDLEKQGTDVGPLGVNDELQQISTHVMANSSGDTKNTVAFTDHKSKCEQSEKFPASNMDLHKTAHLCLKSDGKSDETTADVCVAVSTSLTLNETFPAGVKKEGSEGEGANQLREKKNSNAVADIKPTVRSASEEENKMVDYAREKIVESSMAASDLVCGPVIDGCDSDQAASSKKVEKDNVEEPPCPSLEVDSANATLMHEGLTGSISTEQQPLPVVANHVENLARSGENAVTPISGNILRPDNVEESKPENIEGMEMWSHLEPSDNQRSEQTSVVGPVLEDRVGASVGLLVVDYNKSDGAVENSERKGASDHSARGSAPHEESATIPTHETEQCAMSMESKSSVKADIAEDCTSTAKLDFDLNEGFPVDEGNQGETVTSTAPVCSSAVHQPSQLPFPGSISSGLPASITVAAAAKGSFQPPENLSMSKGELRWKGSAATSAFRPAEPRKILEMPLSTSDVPPSDNTTVKQGRAPLDIDLNVADDRVNEDMASQSSVQDTGSESGPIGTCDVSRDEMFGSSPAPGRGAGGLDLDLNIVDGGTENGQLSSSGSRRLEVPLCQLRATSSCGFPNGVVHVPRDFDLNNGPGLDEVGAQTATRYQHPKSNAPFLTPVAGFRMNNTEIGSLSTWFPPANSYSAVAIPSFLTDRGDQPYPIIANAGAQRMLGSPTGGTFGGDIYRGPVLSSSPAMAFSPAPAFPYAGFSFGTSYPLPSSSFAGGSTTYVESSSGGGPSFPPVPTQLVGPAGAVSSHYPRPYVISLPEGTTSGGAESSRKWERQGLDLNAGPGSTDMGGRDDMFSSAPRQLSVTSSHALAEEQTRMYQVASGALKRKEPEGGWDSERFIYKQPPWH
ncbi:uncharacterized protein LOC143851697 [Tasmannia lanceolata]|uniref:uncharacterized protein LOC143851697 n=1 Tax=Tasmannia lanceolata TaxID=3420 RepID=UPI004062ACB5